MAKLPPAMDEALAKIESDALTIADAAYLARCSPMTMYRLIKRKEVPAFMLLGALRIWREDVPENAGKRRELSA